MRVFVDTSAFVAVLDADDENHQKAKGKWEDLILKNVTLVCSNYILVETFALIQHRIGIEAVRTFQEDVVPMITVEWVGEPMASDRGDECSCCSKKETKPGGLC